MSQPGGGSGGGGGLPRHPTGAPMPPSSSIGYSPPASLPASDSMTATTTTSTPSSSSSQQPPTPVKKEMGIYDTIMSRTPESPLSSIHYTAEAALHRPVSFHGSTSSSGGNGDDDMSLGKLTMRSLPYFQPWRATAGPSELPPNFGWLSESCGGKAAIGVFGGGVMGLLMGVFLGAMSDMTPPVTVINGKEVPQAPLKEQLRTTMRATAEKSLYWCRNFAFITGVFGGSECLVEKYRGKHDVWNAVLSGCVTGAAMQAKQGPQASAIGCGGFAAFSLVIDSFMGTHS